MTQIAEATFYEKINISKLNYILNNPAKYEKQIKEQEKAMRRLNKHYNALAALQKMRENVTIPQEFKGTEFGLLKITYKKAKTPMVSVDGTLIMALVFNHFVPV